MISRMSILIIVSSCIFLVTVSQSRVFAQQDNSSKLVIKVIGFKSNQGKVRISLFNSEQSWLRDALQKSFVVITNNQTELSFDNIPYGEYAVSVFHDENGNGKMDTNFFRIPTESFGFSNGAQGSFGPATWQDAKFQFRLPNEVQKINMTEID